MNKIKFKKIISYLKLMKTSAEKLKKLFMNPSKI